MGWTYRRLDYTTMIEARRDHLASLTRYSDGTKAELLDYEWRTKTLYAIIRITRPNEKPITFLRVDLIDDRKNDFGYKDQCESMGPYVETQPSPEFKAAIFNHIPVAKGYAKDFRERYGIRYTDERQLDLFDALAAA